MRGWYSIPAHRPFLEDLAAGLIAEYGTDPAGLGEAVILLPNRRGARDLAEAFLKAAQGRSAVLLPRILALGDLETGEPPFEPADIGISLPPVVDPLLRRFELARIATAHARSEGREIGAREAIETAEALIVFLDGAQTQGVARPGLLDGLDLGDQARHFEVSARLLNRALEDWSDRRAELGLMDPAERRNAILDRLADQWTAHPPTHPVIAAGMTETAPAPIRLLKVVAEAPAGAVVLPGLDQSLADEAWTQVGPAHPQGALKDMLGLGGIARDDVQNWPGRRATIPGIARQRVINEALRPTEATADWLGVIDRLRRGAEVDPIKKGLDGLTLVSAAHEEEAATLCALLMREAVEAPDKTCALVTPDQGLARRVEARLTRWGLAVDDSAGRPLSRTGVGGLLVLAARLMADPLDPILVLATLKHPDVRAHPKAASGLEDAAFHGPRPRSWDEVRARIDRARRPDHRGVIRPDWRLARLDLAWDLSLRLEALLGAAHDEDLSAEGWADNLAEVIEGLAGVGAWRGPEGEASARLVAGLIEHGAALPPMSASTFAELVQTLTDRETVRGDGLAHPRLRVLGAIEARLVRADRMILAGLEEGVWPRAAPTDPFLSRPMRRDLGLPSPEARLGLGAHDFAQAASAPEVYLVHSERRDGQPAVMSRWLWRLQTLARGAKVEIPRRPELHAWATTLDAPGVFNPVGRPAPTPPLELRPARWSVSDIELLARDPYALWARKILRLERLAPPDEPIDARLRGTAIHGAFEDFAVALNNGADPDPALFERSYQAELEAGGMDAAGLARERALALNTAQAVAAFEMERRADGRRVLVEQQASDTFEVGTRTHRLSARADRVEIDGGRIHVMDFKTGTPPSAKQVDKGFYPQLTLTGALALRGAFEGRKLEPAGLTYVRVSGRSPPIEEKEAWTDKNGGDPVAASNKAWEGLQKRLADFDDPNEAYLSRTAPEIFKDRQDDYAHLARVFEWNSVDSDGGEE